MVAIWAITRCFSCSLHCSLHSRITVESGTSHFGLSVAVREEADASSKVIEYAVESHSDNETEGACERESECKQDSKTAHHGQIKGEDIAQSDITKTDDISKE